MVAVERYELESGDSRFTHLSPTLHPHPSTTHINQPSTNTARRTHVVVLLLAKLPLRLVVHQRPEHGGMRGEHVSVRLQVLLAHTVLVNFGVYRMDVSVVLLGLIWGSVSSIK